VGDFTGIDAKLKRAEENIFCLHDRIGVFFEEGDYPVLPKNDSEAFREAIEYHRNRVVPPQFSVLAGEIVHHLRSCFDHVAWHFSVGPIQEPWKIEFPVCTEEPINKKAIERFEGKIQGITDTNVVGMIKGLQPYNSSDPFDNPLWLIHDFDIIDKHRELVLSVTSGSVFFRTDMRPIIESYQRAHPELSALEVAHQFQRYGTMMPYVSFRNFGRGKFQPVIPGLVDLFNYTLDAVKGFKAL
jgi:hypothetical protein